jgi:hypothetical protein
MLRCTSLLVFASACSLVVNASAQAPSPRQLPQAQPGSFYSAQFSIPPGLGYPFKECQLSGDDLPKTLIFDCQRLQLRGHIPAGIEKTYQISLLVADSAGNSKVFPLTLRISKSPEVVDLGSSTQNSAPPQETAGNTPKISGAPAATQPGTPDPTPKPTETQPAAEQAHTAALNPASDLQTAVAVLKPASITTTIGSSRKHTSLAHAAAKPATTSSAAAGQQSGTATAFDPSNCSCSGDASTNAAKCVSTIKSQLNTALSTESTCGKQAAAAQNKCRQGDARNQIQQLQLQAIQARDALKSCQIDPSSLPTDQQSQQTASNLEYQHRIDFVEKFAQTIQDHQLDVDEGNDITTALKNPENPSGRFEHFGIVGISGSAASSTTMQAKLFAQLYGDAPLWGSHNLLRGWGFLRIGSIAQTDFSAVLNQGSSVVTDVTSLQVQQLVQSGEMGAGLEIPIGHVKYPLKNPALSFIVGGGAITPLSTQQIQQSNQTYLVSPDVQQFYTSGAYAKYLSQFQSTCPSSDTPAGTTPADAGSSACYVAFYPQDRSRFLRNYSFGFRTKVPVPDDMQPTFPFTFDTTVGQNEYVTGGMMRGWVLHIASATPLPYATGLFLFGGMDFGVTGHGDKPGPLLFPTTSATTPAPAAGNTIDIVVPQPNRDRYIFGVGVDIAGVIQRHLQADNAKKQQ